jgi:hypothetical protein
LKKIFFLALEARGWKFTHSKNTVAPLLSSKEKAASIMFLAKNVRNHPRHVSFFGFFGVFNGFLAGEPRLGFWEVYTIYIIYGNNLGEGKLEALRATD